MRLTKEVLDNLPLGSVVVDCDGDEWIKLRSTLDDEIGWRVFDMVIGQYSEPGYETLLAVSSVKEPLIYSPLTLKGSNDMNTVKKSDVQKVLAQHAALYGWGDSVYDALEELGISAPRKKLRVVVEVELSLREATGYWDAEGAKEAVTSIRFDTGTDAIKSFEVVDG